MKKALALILSVVMCVGLFAGCGQQNDANNDGDQDQGSTAKTLVVGTQNAGRGLFPVQQQVLPLLLHQRL